MNELMNCFPWRSWRQKQSASPDECCSTSCRFSRLREQSLRLRQQEPGVGEGLGADVLPSDLAFCINQDRPVQRDFFEIVVTVIAVENLEARIREQREREAP